IGGRNVDFFSQYVSEALRFVEKTNIAINNFSIALFNTIYEQHLYYCLADKMNIPVECYMNTIDETELNLRLKGLQQFREAPAGTGYIHLFGKDAKMDPEICEELACKLKQHYPQYYRRVLQVVRQIEDSNIKIKPDVQRSGSIAI
ncbi:MAG TPA: DUF6734 family protein, partial [Chitinophagaceae bacterium]|nr:DUF6734 family protein [Chitinophagaceae bacterium]